MLVNREVILLKTEVSYGVDAVPVAAVDGLLVENISWSNEGLRLNERPAVRGSIGQLQQVYGGTLRTITFDVEMKGSGVAGTAPEFQAALRACGFAETIVAVTSVTYDPVSDPALHESVTIHYQQDGIRYAIIGARGNVSFNLETGAVPKMSFTFTGHLVGPIDEALTPPVVLALVPEAVIASTFDIGGFAAVVNAVTLDMSNTLALPPDMAAADGFGEVQITARDPAGSYDPEAELLAVDNPHADFQNGASLALSVGPIGATAGNIIDFDCPAVYYRDIAPGDRDGIRTYDIPFGAAESIPTIDDEVAVAFT